MNATQITLKPALAADLQVGSQVDGLPLIELFVSEDSEFHNEWFSALSSRMIVVTDLLHLNRGQMEITFDISDTPVRIHKTTKLSVSS